MNTPPHPSRPEEDIDPKTRNTLLLLAEQIEAIAQGPRRPHNPLLRRLSIHEYHQALISLLRWGEWMDLDDGPEWDEVRRLVRGYDRIYGTAPDPEQS